MATIMLDYGYKLRDREVKEEWAAGQRPDTESTVRIRESQLDELEGVL